MPRDTTKRPFWLLSNYEKLFHGAPKTLEVIYNVGSADGWVFDPDQFRRRTVQADIEQNPEQTGVLVYRELEGEPITLGLNFELPGFDPIQRTIPNGTRYRNRLLVITPIARYEYAQVFEMPPNDSPLFGQLVNYSAFMCRQDRTGEDIVGMGAWTRQLIDGKPAEFVSAGWYELYYRADEREYFDDPCADPIPAND